jgi:hypothetical protein
VAPQANHFVVETLTEGECVNEGSSDSWFRVQLAKCKK